jgi:hypothetical protein
MLSDLPDRLTVSEAAAYIRRSPSFLNKRRVYGGGPDFLKLGSSVLYQRDSLDRWLAANVRRSTSEYQSAGGPELRAKYGL